MRNLVFGIFVAATLLLFVFNGPLLDIAGYRYSLDDGPFFTKIHPASYLLLIGAVVATVAAPRRVGYFVRRPSVIVYAIAVAVLFVKAVFVTLSGETGGEMSMVIVGFLTPLLLLISLQPLNTDEIEQLAVPLRGFFVLNSLMALAERAVHHRFIPSFLDATTDQRASALVGHPLTGALLTGLMIIFLVTARRRDASVASRLPEIALHAAAMFAFGGRSALVFTPVILVLSAVLGRQRRGEVKLTVLQRALPFAVVIIGLCLIFLPLEFVDQTLDRFSQDANSSETRNSALTMITALPASDLLNGLSAFQRVALAKFYRTPAGFELAWIALTVTYGLLAVLPLMVGLPWLLFSTARSRDRSAFYLVLFFLVVTAGSIGFGVKTLIISQLLVLVVILCHPRRLAIGSSAGSELFRNIGMEPSRRREGEEPSGYAAFERSLSGGRQNDGG